MSRKRVFTLAILALFLLMACDFSSLLPSGGSGGPSGEATTDPQVLIDQAVAATMAYQTQVALSVQQTMAAAVTDTPQSTFTPSLTPSITPSLTPQSARVSVSIDTNCRTGPGTVYPILGALNIGQIAEVIGRSASSDNWIIKLPSNPAITCWLWGQYATVTGNTASLPVFTPPPTPTPSSITLTIYNNTGVTIWSVWFDLTTDPWTVDRLGASTMPNGSSYSWVIPPGVYDVKVQNSSSVILDSWGSVSMFADTNLTANP